MEESTYVIRPNFNSKFRSGAAQKIIHEIVKSHLSGKVYSAEEASQWTAEISAEVKTQLKALNLERYKYVVQVVIGEQRGEGVKMACKCFWDSDSDNFAQDVYMNDSLFCVVAAFGVYFY